MVSIKQLLSNKVMPIFDVDLLFTEYLFLKLNSDRGILSFTYEV